MPEDTNTVENNVTQDAAAEPEKTFTQAEMDAIIGDRLKRERAKYADYEELKGKAAKYDEAEEASKSELQKAVEERDALRERLEKLEKEQERAAQVAKVAAEQGVDAALLARMSGDVEENAQFLKQQQEAKPKYGAVHDGGETKPTATKHEIPKIF